MTTAIKHPAPDGTGLRRHLYFLTSGHWRSGLSVRVPGCQKIHMTTRSGTCIHVATVGVKGLIIIGLYFVEICWALIKKVIHSCPITDDPMSLPLHDFSYGAVKPYYDRGRSTGPPICIRLHFCSVCRPTIVKVLKVKCRCRSVINVVSFSRLVNNADWNSEMQIIYIAAGVRLTSLEWRLTDVYDDE